MGGSVIGLSVQHLQSFRAQDLRSKAFLHFLHVGDEALHTSPEVGKHHESCQVDAKLLQNSGMICSSPKNVAIHFNRPWW